MRTMRRTLFILLVLALPMTTAVAALGKGRPPAERAGYTCAQLGVDQSSHGLSFTDTGFTFTLSGKSDDMCVDVLHATPGVWQVSATSKGTVLRLLLVPRDSYGPGDSCGGVDLRPPTFPLTQVLPPPGYPNHDVIPAATVNACGTEFGEWINSVPVMVATGDPNPLAFYALMQGRPGAETTITVTLP